MKKFIRIFALVCLLATPISGTCSYLSTDPDSPIELEFPKCLILVDMIKDTKDQIKKSQLKTNLEIELLFLMDRIIVRMEKYEGQDEYFQALQKIYNELEGLLEYTR